MTKALGRDLQTILNDVENSYKEIELENQSLKKEKNEIKIENFVKQLKEKYKLSVENEGNNLIINVNSQKKLKKLKKIFNI